MVEPTSENPAGTSAKCAMKHPGSFRPEPPPPKHGLLPIILALAAMTIGLGLGLYSFHDAGVISGEMFTAAMVFIVALSAGIVIAMDIERRVHRDAQKQASEVPPPFDIYAVWPLDVGAKDGPQKKVAPPLPKKSDRPEKP